MGDSDDKGEMTGCVPENAAGAAIVPGRGRVETLSLSRRHSGSPGLSPDSRVLENRDDLRPERPPHFRRVAGGPHCPSLGPHCPFPVSRYPSLLWNSIVVSHCTNAGGKHGSEPWRLQPASRASYELAKRLLDAIVALVVIAVCLPLGLAIAAAIKLDSRGSVFFSQKRVGRRGVMFRMLKFRSMLSDAERLRARLTNRNDNHGPVFKMRNDPRITRVGRFLRKTSLDELPQFLNVLLGQMSLVGPRPLPASDVTDYDCLPADVTAEMVHEWLAVRQEVRPGITGLWQVSGRSLLPLLDWVRYDLRYVRERSLLLDARILAVTPFAALSGRGAV